ncbi:hypothetical protein LCGC14_0791670 [marine sediment metagenome]|uniref:Uncharacterized protein n=1 Tax=marine sediment metagenome TaxID=412755 RepID=A0A0F9SCC0_9ZZZZ
MIALEVPSRSPSLLALASSVPIGQRGLVHIWGRNDMPMDQKMGISWEVKGPDGMVVEAYSDWQLFNTDPGDEHEFIGDRFDLDREGTYTLEANLLMNRDSPVVVDRYQGGLVTVERVAIPPEYVLKQHVIYPWAYTFEGDAEICTFEFKLTPEQIPVYSWLGERIIDSFVGELEKDGSRLLELNVYEDTTPTFWTNYRVEVTATASPLLWTAIILGVLAILFVIAVIFAIKTIDKVFFNRKVLDEETIKAFSRETLIAMILDLEPETPPETLEVKTDQELRDLLNQILAGKAPVAWWPLAVLGGVAILGAGAAVALVTRSRRSGP